MFDFPVVYLLAFKCVCVLRSTLTNEILVSLQLQLSALFR